MSELTRRDDLADSEGIDEALGNELDKHLSSLEGAPVAGTALGSGEIADLVPVVEKLHRLARYLESVPLSAADAGTSELDETRSASPVKNDRREEPVAPPAIGKYEIRKRLGAGGQAATYLANDPDLQRPVVLKLYHQTKTAAEQARVLYEGQALARVRSPFVAQCYHADRHEGIPYLVVEYIAGESLADRLKRGPMSLRKALELTAQVSDGLAAVHACGLLHRDIKPGNILIGDDGRPRLVDFGLAAALGSDELRQVSGTLPYMAPEQASAFSARIDPRSDIFGLGAVLYHLLSDTPPYQADSRRELYEKVCTGDVVPISQRKPDLPKAVVAVCQRCLARDPAGRFRSATELRDAVRRAMKKRVVFDFAARLGRWQVRLAVATSMMLVLGFASQLYYVTLTPSESRLAFEKPDKRDDQATPVVTVESPDLVHDGRGTSSTPTQSILPAGNPMTAEEYRKAGQKARAAWRDVAVAEAKFRSGNKGPRLPTVPALPAMLPKHPLPEAPPVAPPPHAPPAPLQSTDVAGPKESMFSRSIILRAIDRRGRVHGEFAKATGLTHAAAFSYRFMVLDQDGRKRFVNPDTYAFRTGERFQLEIEPHSDLHVYVVSEGPDGFRAIPFPTLADRGLLRLAKKALVRKGQKTVIPDADSYLELRPAVGIQRLHILAAPEPRAELDADEGINDQLSPQQRLQVKTVQDGLFKKAAETRKRAAFKYSDPRAVDPEEGVLHVLGTKDEKGPPDLYVQIQLKTWSE